MDDEGGEKINNAILGLDDNDINTFAVGKSKRTATRKNWLCSGRTFAFVFLLLLTLILFGLNPPFPVILRRVASCFVSLLDWNSSAVLQLIWFSLLSWSYISLWVPKTKSLFTSTRLIFTSFTRMRVRMEPCECTDYSAGCCKRFCGIGSGSNTVETKSHDCLD